MGAMNRNATSASTSQNHEVTRPTVRYAEKRWRGKQTAPRVDFDALLGSAMAKQFTSGEPATPREQAASVVHGVSQFDLMIGAPSHVIQPIDLEPVVYVWMRGAQCMYVGESSRGLRRVFNAQHSGLADFSGDDLLFVWPAPADDTDRRALEVELIRLLRPKRNVVGNSWEKPAGA